MLKITGGASTVKINIWNCLQVFIAYYLESRLFVCSVLNICITHSPLPFTPNSTFKNAGKVHRYTFHPHYSLLRGINSHFPAFSYLTLVSFRSHPQVNQALEGAAQGSGVITISESIQKPFRRGSY